MPPSPESHHEATTPPSAPRAADMTHTRKTTPLRQPHADLPRQLITAYVTGAGYDFHELLARAAADEDARRLLTDAGRYASARLSEIEARSHYVHELHGTAEH